MGVLSLAGSPAQAQTPTAPPASTNDIGELVCRLAHVCPDDNGVLNAD